MLKLMLLKEFKNQYKVNTTRANQSMNIWHSTFPHFLNIMKGFYWSSQQTQVWFVVFKRLPYSNVGWVLQWTKNLKWTNSRDWINHELIWTTFIMTIFDHNLKTGQKSWLTLICRYYVRKPQKTVFSKSLHILF